MLMNAEIVYWMPSVERTFLTPSDVRMAELTAIEVSKGQELDYEIYLFLLSERVQNLLDESEDYGWWAMEIERIMVENNLANYTHLNTGSEPGMKLIAENPLFREHLHLLGVRLPKILVTLNDPQAEEAYKEADNIEIWSDVLLATMPAELS